MIIVTAIVSPIALPKASNTPPVIPEIETQLAYEDVQFIFDIPVIDVDDNNHSFSVSMDTTFVNYSLANNSLIITPTENWFGEVLINVSVSDDEFISTQSFLTQFQSVNDSPVILPTVPPDILNMFPEAIDTVLEFICGSTMWDKSIVPL